MIAAVLFLLAGCVDERSEQAPDGGEISMKTLGGLQFWADVFYFEGWRIQKHASQDTHRLLDPKGSCHRMGSEADCLERLKEETSNPELKPQAQHHVVLLLHGIIRTRHSMRPMQKHLEKHGFRCYCVSYPSTRLPIEEHARNLAQIVVRLKEATQISFVCHSMGGLVVRKLLTEHADPRIKRVVMMGTPNRGAEMADKLSGVGAYRFLFGPAGQQLVTAGEGIVDKLPACVDGVECGIIAGGKRDKGYSWLLEGDDDGTVTVESTKLPGARDFLVVPSIHMFLMNSEQAQEATLNFLQHGYFVSKEARTPIPAEEPIANPKAQPMKEGS